MLVVHHVIEKAKKRLRMGTNVFFGTEAECQTLAHDINNKREGEDSKSNKKNPKKQSETELTASVLEKDPKHTRD